MNAGKVCSPALTDLEILLVCVVVITWRSYKQGERKEGLHCTEKQTALDSSTLSLNGSTRCYMVKSKKFNWTSAYRRHFSITASFHRSKNTQLDAIPTS